MVERVLAAADIERVAVGKKGLPAQLAYIVRNNLRILRTKMSKIAQLSEMDLDRCVAVGKINLLKASRFHQAVQFLWECLIWGGVEIGKVYGSFCHFYQSFAH